MSSAKRAIGARLASSVCLVALLTGQSASAQSEEEINDAASRSEERTGPIEQVVVTAQKRTERINDVPMSITATSGAQLDKQGITDPGQLEKIVPGFTYLLGSFGVPVFQIRGIGLIDATLAASPTVSVYADQVPLPYLAMTKGVGLDVERLEVLKGPQGTLFGQNSTGGAINYIAAKPTSTPKAGTSLTYGRFDQIDAEGFVSGPVAGNLTGRIAIRTEHRGDWQHSTTRDDSLGERNFTTGRAILDWQPSDAVRFELNLNGWTDKSDTQANQFVTFSALGSYPEAAAALSNYQPAPQDNRAADWDPNGSFKHDDSFYQASLRADWDISDQLTLTSISAYSNFDQRVTIDADGSNFNVQSPHVRGIIDSFSQELRVAGQAGDAASWMVGGNYSKERADEDNTLESTSSRSGVGPFRYRFVTMENHQDVETMAVFGSLDYRMTSSLTAQTSLRYTDQDRTFKGCVRDFGDGRFASAIAFLSSQLTMTPVVIPAGGCATLGADNFPAGLITSQLNQDNVSWRGGLSWKPADDTLLYANATKGFKSGGYSTVPGVRAVQYIPVTQESVLAYEIGFKASLLGRAVQLTGAAFYDDYKNKQILGFVNTGPPFFTLPAQVNIPKSRVVGAELELGLRLVSPLTVTLGAAYVDSKVIGDYVTTDQASSIVNIEGEQFPNSPKWQLMGDAEYDFALVKGWRPYLGASATYRSEAYAFFGRSPFFRMNGYALIDLRAGMESADGRWRLQLFGRNITDKYYLINANHINDVYTRTAGAPATYGVTVNYRMN